MNATTAGPAAPPAGTSDELALFQLELRQTDSCDLLVLSGALGADAVQPLHGVALQALSGGRQVEVDWSAATVLSACALQVLLALRSGLNARAQQLPVSGDNPAMRHWLELAGLSDLFPCRESV